MQPMDGHKPVKMQSGRTLKTKSIRQRACHPQGVNNVKPLYKRRTNSKKGLNKMKYRYFSTQRPVAPGTFPKKPGCEISNYPQKFYIDGMGFDAWGHIDYDEPLTDAEVKDYELQPARYEFSVKFNPDNEQMGRIHKLFKRWCEYVAEDGSKPFADYTIEKFFEVMMQSGSFHTINRHIENMEYELK